jgi:hypothetical protein
MLLLANNNITTSCNQIMQDEPNNSNNVITDVARTAATLQTTADLNTTNCRIVTSPVPIIPTSNTTSNISALPSTHTKSCFDVASPDLVNLKNITNHAEIVYSPMDIEVSFLMLFLIHGR